MTGSHPGFHKMVFSSNLDSASFALFFSQTPVLTLSEAREMMEPKTVELEGSVTVHLFLSSVSSVIGPQRVASPRLKELGHRWMGGCCSKGEGCGSKERWTLMDGEDDEIMLSIETSKRAVGRKAKGPQPVASPTCTTSTLY